MPRHGNTRHPERKKHRGHRMHRRGRLARLKAKAGHGRKVIVWGRWET